MISTTSAQSGFQAGCRGADYLREQFQVSEEQAEMYRTFKCLDVLEKCESRYADWLVLCDYAEQHGVLGMVLRNRDDTQWCMITLDPKPGYARYSYLDRRGFIGHGEYLTPELALKEAFGMSFCWLDSPTKPDEVIMSPDWVGL